ncbi:glycosyltransferase [Pseudomonas sp. P7548]|uniref:glycosyltransferase n=1 Tax=Pseudomonas sp. P7548 TaxID=2726981 RepID=UPI002115EE60|nr:glycosyltransferase [Pseudomonas sp. P7548]
MINSRSVNTLHKMPAETLQVQPARQRRAVDAPHQSASTLLPIPAGSVFGQWWSQLGQAFESPDVQQWIQDKGINPDSIKINPASGQIAFTVKAERGQPIHTLGLDDPGWAAVSGPILNAGRVIAPGGPSPAFSPPLSARSNTAPFKVMTHFYKTSPFFSVQHNSRSEQQLEAQQAQLADIRNRYQAAYDLRHLAGFVREGTRDQLQIAHELETRVVYVDNAGTYRPANAGDHNSVSLKQFIEDHGWKIPTTLDQLDNLVDALLAPAPKPAENGNYGGARAWPTPLDAVSEQQLRSDLQQGRLGGIDLAPFNNVLDYLLNGSPVLPEHIANPRGLIDRLIASPRGQALGQAIQAQFEARAVKGSINDWLLAALSLDLSASTEAAPEATQLRIAGYTLLSASNAGKTAAAVMQELTAALAKAGKGLSPEQAAIQATLMLASRAPEFLVKDLPQDLVLGTHSWVSFATAVARIEASAPGATAAMTYAQLMTRASIAPVSDDEARIEFEAQSAALKDWAVANGLPYPVTHAAMTRVREAFAAQVSQLEKASHASTAKLPTARDMALEQLKKALPDVAPKHFDEKCIRVEPSNRYFPGPYSILDLYIDGRGLLNAPSSADNWGESGRDALRAITLGLVDLPGDGRPGTWVSSSSGFDIQALLPTLKQLPRLPTAFDEAFSAYSEAVKTATAAHIKNMVAKLPLADRQHFEFGEITLARETHFEWGGVLASERDKETEGRLLIKIKRDGQVHTYQLDRLKGTITQRPDLGDFKTGEPYYKESRPFNAYKIVTPEGQYPTGLADESKGASGVPDSFGSARTAYLADAVLQDMDLPGLKKAARGQTTFDTEVPTHEKAAQFGLNLIPFRSAIVNFQNGNVAQGLGDLSWDVFGFLVGFGTAIKGAKAAATGLGALAKAGHALKIVGRAAVGALNPAGGLDDLARGVVNGTARVFKAGYRGLRYLRTQRSVDLLALAKRPDIAEGSYKAINATAESKALATFDEATGQWYAVDPHTRQAYGKPLDNFVAEATTTGASDSLRAIGSADETLTASQHHGLAASGTFKEGLETVESTAVMFQGNWHRYDALKKQPFGPPLKDFTPSRVATGGEVRPLDATLRGYEAQYIATGELSATGLQGNVYKGRSGKEYVKVDGVLYESRLKDGQRIIRHPKGTGADIPIRDLGTSGWEPSARSARLLGGTSELTSPWRLGDSTYVVPMDDIKVVENSITPYTLNYKGVDQNVVFDSAAGAWKEASLAPGADALNPAYFWRSAKGKWQRGPFSEFIKARKAQTHHYKFVDVTPSAAISLLKAVKPVPKNLHYFWAGQEIPPKLMDNLVNNANKAPGYTSILHVDADSPAIFQQIKQKLESRVPGTQVKNLHEDDVFKQLKTGGMYDYFRAGQGKNLAAASDVARYPIANKYGGFYLDTDDVIQTKVGADAVNAGANDVLLNQPVGQNLTGYKLFYNTSNFGTHAGNPVITDLITEMKQRFVANKPYFQANRPTITRAPNGQVLYTPEFQAYERKVFETVGPTLFNDNLKLKRPDMYDLGFDGKTREYHAVNGGLVPHGPKVNVEHDIRQSYIRSGIVPPDTLGMQLDKLKKHYFPLQYKLNVRIGAEHSWIES